MKKIILLVFAIAINSFALYVDAGIGFGGGASKIDDISLDKTCKGCDEVAVDLGFRIGGKVSESIWLAGEFGGFGHRFYDSDNYMQFNSYFIGPSFMYYPMVNFQLSGSMGFAWTSNTTDIPGYYLYDGVGSALAISAAYDTGLSNGALIGLRIYRSSVTLEENRKDLVNMGLTVFVRFVHK